MLLSDLFGANYLLTLFCFLDPRRLVETGGWSSCGVPLPLCKLLPNTLTQSSTAALMSASPDPLPNCFISWMVLSPH